MGNYGRIADSIVGWGSSTGQWARIENKCVIGEDVHMKVGCPRQTVRVLIVLESCSRSALAESCWVLGFAAAGLQSSHAFHGRCRTMCLAPAGSTLPWLLRSIAPKAVRNTPTAQHMLPEVPCVWSALPDCLACR